MSTSGGLSGPVPPKRPTVIRPNTNAGPPVPSRPAPPMPVRKTNDEELPKQLPPPPPARPRPNSVISTTTTTTQHNSSRQSANSNNGKRRPEITIVSARPMSEIGFRDVHASEQKHSEDTKTKPEEPIRNNLPPAPPARPVVTPAEPKPASRVPPRPAAIKPTVPNIASKPDFVTREDDDNKPVRAPPPIPRLPPSPRLRKAGADDTQKSTTVPTAAPVPIPRNPAVKPEPTSDAVVGDLIDVSAENTSDTASTTTSTTDALYSVINKPKRPTIIRPNRPAAKEKSQPDQVVDDASSNSPLLPQKVLPTPISPHKNEQTDAGLDNTDGDMLKARKSFFEIKQEDNVPEFLKKRLKPTVTNDEETSEGQHPTVPKKPLPPPSKPKPSIPSQSKPPPLPGKPRPTPTDDAQSTDTKTVPETLKTPPSPPVKPKPSSPRKSDTNDDDSPSGNSKPPSPPPARLKPNIFTQFDKNEQNQGHQPASKPNILPTKPKPTIIPKPQVASKPISPKQNEDTENITNVKDNSPIDKSTNGEKNETQSKPVTDSNVKPSTVKRPTIIRPLRGVQSISSENLNQTELSLKSDDNLQTSDENINMSTARPQPPLPNKRPVSMINIPEALAQEEKKDNSTPQSNLFTSQSTENISNLPSSSPKPNPRPAARPRPASMMMSQSSRPPLPASGPKVQSKDTDSISPPHRPPQRPAGSRMSAIGIPVLPRLDNKVTEEKEKDNSEMDNSEHNESVRRRPPPKVSQEPAKRPPPPSKLTHDEKESSSDDEFFNAQSKPDRPSGPPRPRPRTHSDDTHTDTHTDTSPDKRPPPRPTAGPPPGRKSSFNTANDDDSTAAKVKPERPGSKPSIPTSTPPKSDQPTRPQPPKPAHSKQTRGTNGPTLPSRPGPNHPLYSYMMKAPHGIALFDYSPRHEDELQFKTGDVIILKRMVDSDWLIGQVGESEGMFPKDFVKVKIPLPGQEIDIADSSDENEEMYFDTSPEKPDTIGVGPRCRARFDFDGEGADDLPFEEGDMIKLLERVGPEWRKGECNGRVGVFPLVYVEIIEDMPDVDETQNKGTVVKAMFDFDGEAGELSFQAGESIEVKYMVNEEWLYGQIGERGGQFPVQFIDHVPPDLPPLPETKPQHEAKPAVDPLTASLAMWDTVENNHEQAIPTNDVKHDTALSPNWKHDEPTTSTEHKTVDSNTETIDKHHVDEGEQPYCVALYDYPGETADDLKFDTGDRIDLVEKVNEDWLKGSCHGRTGIFPAAFVEIKIDFKEDSSIPDNQNTDTNTDWNTPSHSTYQEFGLAQYDFVGESDNELTFTAGDKIQLLDLVPGAEDWRNGVLDGKTGIFPAAFVLPES